MSRSWALWAPRRCCCQMPPSTWPAGRTSTTGEPSVHGQSCSASLMQLASFAQIWHKGEASQGGNCLWFHCNLAMLLAACKLLLIAEAGGQAPSHFSVYSVKGHSSNLAELRTVGKDSGSM